MRSGTQTSEIKAGFRISATFRVDGGQAVAASVASTQTGDEGHDGGQEASAGPAG